jgi:hypothetical protein
MKKGLNVYVCVVGGGGGFGIFIYIHTYNLYTTTKTELFFVNKRKIIAILPKIPFYASISNS